MNEALHQLFSSAFDELRITGYAREYLQRSAGLTREDISIELHTIEKLAGEAAQKIMSKDPSAGDLVADVLFSAESLELGGVDWLREVVEKIVNESKSWISHD